MDLINVLYTAVSQSYGDYVNQEHLHLSGTVLMCELGYDVFENVIRDRLEDMQRQFKAAPENKKVVIREQINRVTAWASQFAKDHESYTKSTQAIQTIRSNHFDDDLIESSLLNLKSLWKKDPKSRHLTIVEFGHLDTILACLRNADEGVVQNTCEALEVLLSGSKERNSSDLLINLIDLIVRHGGVALLDTQCRAEGNLDIKKAALKVMIKVLQASKESQSLREMVQDEIKRL